jgi:hypothetical protein
MTKNNEHIWVVETKEDGDKRFLPHEYAFVRSIARDLKEQFEADGYEARVRKYVPEDQKNFW